MTRAVVWALCCAVWFWQAEPVRANVAGYYTPATGDFSLLVGSQAPDSLLAYLLTPTPPHLFRAENFQPITDSPYVDRLPTQLGEGRFSPLIPAGLHSLGRILPEGLNVDDFGSFFASRRYAPGLGQPLERSDLYYGAMSENPLFVEGSPEITTSNPETDLPIPWATEVRLDYFATSGFVSIYGNGKITAFQLFDAQAGFVIDQLSPFPGLHGFSAENIGYSSPSDPAPTSFWLGSVLPSGLTVADLQERLALRFVGEPAAGAITSVQFASPADIPASWGTINVSVYEILPEPSVLPCFLMAAILILRRRRPADC